MNHETDVSHAFKDGVNATLIDDPKNEVARFFNEVNCKFCGAELYAFPCQNDETTYWRCGTDHTDERGFERSWSCYEKELAASQAEVERLKKELDAWDYGTRAKREQEARKKAETEVESLREKLDTAIEIAEDALWYAPIYENEIQFNKMDVLYQKLVALKNK